VGKVTWPTIKTKSASRKWLNDMKPLLRNRSPQGEEEAVKFFTPDLLGRFGSADENIAFEAQQELEALSEEYLRQLREIDQKLPQRFRDLLHQFYLHDSRVVSRSSFGVSAPDGLADTKLSKLTNGAKRSAQEGRLPAFWILLRLDTQPREILVLQYRSVLIEEARVHQSPGDEECPYLEWLYDEVELIPTGRDNEFRHSILFTKGLELSLRFKDFDFTTLESMEFARGFAEAEVLVRRAPATGEQRYRLDYAAVARDFNDLSAPREAPGRPDEAEPLIRSSPPIDDWSDGPDHQNAGSCLTNLAIVLRDINRVADAELLIRLALTIDETSFGPEHPIVATGLNNLATLFHTTNRLAEAEPLFRRALAIWENSLGPNHPQVATALSNLALLLQDTNRLDEAEPLHR
jgi:tetratricopeptide (TPR) repeat protein